MPPRRGPATTDPYVPPQEKFSEMSDALDAGQTAGVCQPAVITLPGIRPARHECGHVDFLVAGHADLLGIVGLAGGVDEDRRLHLVVAARGVVQDHADRRGAEGPVLEPRERIDGDRRPTTNDQRARYSIPRGIKKVGADEACITTEIIK